MTDHIPTPAEIRQRCEEIQQGWTEAQERQRQTRDRRRVEMRIVKDRSEEQE